MSDLCWRLCGTAAKEAFKAFDKKHENKIKVGDCEAAMKRLGHTIKPDWLEKVEHMIDSAGETTEPLRCLLYFSMTFLFI